jgi:hypothetical protein
VVAVQSVAVAVADYFEIADEVGEAVDEYIVFGRATERKDHLNQWMLAH